MYKFKKHRREITKDFPLGGTYTTRESSGDSLVLDGALCKRFSELEIQGKTYKDSSISTILNVNSENTTILVRGKNIFNLLNGRHYGASKQILPIWNNHIV